ncbi:MAG: SDR family NAD(P)-dependent oxidoreductase [Streptosporangiaceae bacterium]
MHGRVPERGEEATREIRAVTGNEKVSTTGRTSASLEEVAGLASDLAAHHDRLDVLVNNAGIGRGRRGEDRRELSHDGHELRFAVNYLAAFLPTHRLLPLLRASARIVNVSSVRHRSTSTTSCPNGATTVCVRTPRASWLSPCSPSTSPNSWPAPA